MVVNNYLFADYLAASENNPQINPTYTYTETETDSYTDSDTKTKTYTER